MLNVFLYAFFCVLITFLLQLCQLLTHKQTQDKEKSSAFECGYDPSGRTRLPFCMKFFLIGVIFLIFDVEIALILPLPFAQTFILFFLMLLMGGLAYEWFYGGLDWIT